MTEVRRVYENRKGDQFAEVGLEIVRMNRFECYRSIGTLRCLISNIDIYQISNCFRPDKYRGFFGR